MSALAVAPVPTGSWLDDATIEGNLVNIVIAQAIQTARLTRAIDEASTVTLGILDPARELLGSPLWKQASRLKADAKTYVLVQTRKQANKFTLTFEDETVYKLRQPDTYQASRGNETWVDFITRLCKQSGIKVYAPEIATAIGLNTRVPNRGATPPDNVPRDAPSGTTGSFEAGTTPTVTNHGGSPPAAGARPWMPASGEQLRALTIALNVATDLCHRNHLSDDQTSLVLVAMIAAGAGESGWHNASHNSDQGGHYGIFQQSPQYYTAPHDIAIATHEFLIGARTWGPPVTYTALPGTAGMIGILKGARDDDLAIGRLIALVQRPGPVATYGPYYAQFIPEARQTASYWTGAPVAGATPSTITTATPGLTGQWFRGKSQQYETTWDCAKRLSSDQAYRCFVGPGDPLNLDEDVVWLVTDQWLINRPAAAVLHENSGAIETIDWEIDQGRRRPAGSSQRAPMDTATVTALDTWNVEPGSVVRLAGEGPASTGPGRWLVTRWERDAVKPDSTITLGKPIEKLPPPGSARPAAPFGTQATGDEASQPPSQRFRVGASLVQPIPLPFPGSMGGIHETDGLPGYPATDFFAAAGAPVVAVENGTIERFSGHDPRFGPVSGVHGPFGWSIYLLGDSGTDYFITHLGSRTVAVGQKVQAGQQIGTVGNYAKYGGSNHTHIGVHPGPTGHPDVTDLRTAEHAVRT